MVLNAIDRQVLAALDTQTPRSNQQIAQALGLRCEQTYRSLYKLKKAGLVQNWKPINSDLTTYFTTPGQYVRT